MAYELKKRSGGIRWKLVWRDYSTSEGRRYRERTVKVSELPGLGLTPEMSLDEARSIVKHLNAQSAIVAKERKRNSIESRVAAEKVEALAFLPEVLVLRFESEVLFKRFGAKDSKEYKRLLAHWAAAQRIVSAIKSEPQFWSEAPEPIFEFFTRKRFSLSYTEKILRVLNLWARFYCRQRNQFFEPIPTPTGFNRERIADAFHEKGKTKASLPLSPSQLESKRADLDPEHYLWIKFSIWFGLRPIEIDSLKKVNSWRLAVERDGSQTLWVYQSKLGQLPRDKRWKLIPILREEQRELLREIREGKFRRPLPKTMRLHFGEGVNCYAGRKGFTDLMLDLGHPLEDVSAWMGHTSIERTWRTYRDRLRVRKTQKR